MSALIKMRKDIKEYLNDVLKVTGVTVCTILFLKIFDQNTDFTTSGAVKSLVEQAAKWYTLSCQDKHTIYAFQHSNFALSYLNAARHVTSDSNIERISKIDVYKLYKSINEQQKTCLKNMSKICPKSKIKSTATIGWLT